MLGVTELTIGDRAIARDISEWIEIAAVTVIAVTVGERGNAIATAVVRSIRSVVVAAIAITTKGSSLVSVSTSPSSPSRSTRAASR